MHIAMYISICNYVGAYVDEAAIHVPRTRQWMYISIASTLPNLASRLQSWQIHIGEIYINRAHTAAAALSVSYIEN